MAVVIVVQDEAEDYGEDGMETYWTVSKVVGPFASVDLAVIYDRKVFPPNPYRQTEIVELETV